MAVEYRTFTVPLPRAAEKPLSAETRAVLADKEIEKLRKKKWHLRTIWYAEGTTYLTMWRED